MGSVPSPPHPERSLTLANGCGSRYPDVVTIRRASPRISRDDQVGTSAPNGPAALGLLSGACEGPPLSREEVDTYLGAVDWLRGSWPAPRWRSMVKPSALAHYTVGGVAAHAVHGVLWLEQVLKDAEPVGLRQVTVGEFFGVNRVDDAEDGDPLRRRYGRRRRRSRATGPPIVVAACTASRDELVGLLSTVSSSGPFPSSGCPAGRCRSRLPPDAGPRGGRARRRCVCSVPSPSCPTRRRRPSRSVSGSASSWPEPGSAIRALRAFTRAERSLPAGCGCCSGPGPRRP